MNKLLTAIALTIAIPAVAYAQPSPTPEAKPGCCEKMKAEGKECCCKGMMDHAKPADQPKAGGQGSHQR